MTAITGAGTLNQQLYMRLFERLDMDKSNGVSVEELSATSRDAADSVNILKTLDRDGDGHVSRAEMTPSAQFGAQTLNALLAAQTDDEAARTDAEIVADLFARADLDGDGAINAAEMDAETASRRAANLDAGFMAGPIFVPADRNRDGLLTQDEIGVGRQIQSLGIPSSAIHFLDELPPEEQARFNAIRKEQGLPPAPRYSEAEKQAMRDQWDADRAERASGPDGTTTFLQRELDEFRGQARAEFSAGDLSDALTDRLLRQILDPSWSSAA